MKNYVGLVMDWEAQIVVRREEVNPMQLGQNCQLGWVSWLVKDPPARDPDDAVLEPR